mmetsp:Transcript_9331/g.18417  ORF Transcript_9331/g.18417 Transcript_9331/m.18417 type:complete len:398 (+) Transcript_9331:169-1362(+)|eukprot:CAMPEP_0171528040 /NCGR_PEP_ID=MMETSP0959-20130129/11417_1 /TAXON_ID=87120 /ORGANISM="Aurantiochytrium limacinum, Strain ATCCMYA-1381" /LENGTH=397 /DNA_ID=CAMNT_0012069909 /DNA_START=106 /DNA_END=1299 /DNA_ORIENTATION=+
MDCMLSQALGPRPQSLVLRKAVEVDMGDPEGFFTLLTMPLDGPAQGESVPTYAKRLPELRLSFQDSIIVVPLGNKTPQQNEAQLQLFVDYAKAFLHPLTRIQVMQLPQFATASQMRMYRDARSGRLCVHQLSMALERALPSQDARMLAVSLDIETDLSKEEHGFRLLPGANGGIGFLDLSKPSEGQEELGVPPFRQNVQRICRALCSIWALFAPCKYFVCAMNGELSAFRPFVLCPICLRKLSLIPGPPSFDVIARYVRLFHLYNKNSEFAVDAQWLAERLAHLGQYEFIDQLDKVSQEASSISDIGEQIQYQQKKLLSSPNLSSRQHQYEQMQGGGWDTPFPVRGQSSQSLQDKAEAQSTSMQADLATLKRRMKRTSVSSQNNPSNHSGSGTIYFG